MSKRSKHARSLMALVSISTFLVACAGRGPLAIDQGANDTSVGNESNDFDPVVARVDGKPIHRKAVDQWLQNDWLEGIAEDPARLYQLRRAGVDGVIDDALVDRAAASQAMTASAYLDEKTAALGPISEQEIDDFYARNKERIRPGETLAELRPKIRSFLENDRPVRVITALRNDAKIEILMSPPATPPVVRQQIPVGGASRGAADAPIRIVEFSDFQCPYCRQAEVTLRQLDALYPGKLRVEYRHLPLNFHANAIPAAKAANCAGNQNRFWEYHSLLFKNQSALGADHLVSYAKQLGLGIAEFQACFAAPETLAHVEQDIAVAKAAGATATPTFFVNGITLRGAQPAEAFRAIIDGELAQQAAAP